MKALIIGGGFVGKNLADYFKAPFTSTSGEGKSIKLDIKDRKKTKAVIEKFKPDVVINASGLTSVDQCELNRADAMEINGTAVENIVNACDKIGAKFVQISTDYVFSGKKGNYSEDDSPNPINYYGLSKLIGEEEAMKHGDAIILRISTPYGKNQSKKVTFQDFVAKSLKEGKAVDIVADQYTSPTYIGDIPKAIEQLYNYKQKGIFHLGSSRISRYAFAVKLSQKLNLPKGKIRKAKLSDMKFKAPRPSDTSFNCKKISKFFKISDLDKSMTAMVKGSL